MSSTTDLEKQAKKESSREIEEIDDDDDEEARMRDRLLARRAKQLKEMIDAEPADERTAPTSTASKKSHHHHHHKKKKRRQGSMESEESGSSAKPERLPSVASAVSAVVFGEEDGLNIKPPQATSSAGSSYQKRRKKSMDERSPDYREEWIEARYHHQHRSATYDFERKRRERADEGWATWKRSLDRPYSYGRGPPVSHRSGELHGRSRSPSSKVSSRQGYRPREVRVSPSPSSSSRWPASKTSGGSDWSRNYASTGRQQVDRGDKRTFDERHGSAEPHEKSAKRSRTQAESAGAKAPISTAVSPSSAAVTVVSPEATPTMDELGDIDVKHPQTASDEKPKEGKRTRGEAVSYRQPAEKISPRSGDRSGSTEGKSNRSSMESGERRSDNEDTGSREHKKGEMEVKKAKYSKFESSSSESSSESDADQAIYQRGQESDDGSDVDEDAGAHNKDLEKTATGAEAVLDPVDLDVSPAPEFAEPILPVYFPALMGCRSVEEFHSLNRIEEGTYGVVYRAKEKRTDEIVALKRLKMEKEKEGFPITSLREINMLLKAGKHPNVVKVREIVVGSNMDKIYLVMDYVEHDLKSLLETMKQPFLIGEVKTLVRQLLAGIKHLHENWILHRDLKTSNLLLSHKGILKIADFGLAREYGSPLKPYTPVVVTLWYRAPELLLGIKEYSTPIDLWSVGCVFAEILTLKPLFTGKSEIEQLNKIFVVLGTPNDTIWPGYSELPGVKRFQFADVKFNYLRKHFGATLSGKGFELMKRLLTYDPEKRISAAEALEEEWFNEEPRPVRPDMFPTWPAKSEQSKPPRKGPASPKPPSGGKQFLQGESDKDYLANLKGRGGAAIGFSLKFDAPKF